MASEAGIVREIAKYERKLEAAERHAAEAREQIRQLTSMLASKSAPELALGFATRSKTYARSVALSQ